MKKTPYYDNLKISNLAGRVFLVRAVLKGDRYGFNDCLVHDEIDPLIEFYDFKYSSEFDADGFADFGPRGQFISRYYAKTLIASNFQGDGLLQLDGGVPEWNINIEALRPVLDLAKALSEVSVAP